MNNNFIKTDIEHNEGIKLENSPEREENKNNDSDSSNNSNENE